MSGCPYRQTIMVVLTEANGKPPGQATKHQGAPVTARTARKTTARTTTKRAPAKRTSPAEATPVKTTTRATAVKKAPAKAPAKTPTTTSAKRDNLARLTAPVPTDATELASHIATARYMIRRATKAGNAELLALAERRLAQLAKTKAVRQTK